MSHRNFPWTSLPHSLPNWLLCSLHQWQVPLSTLHPSLSFPIFSNSCFYPSYHFCTPTSLHPLFHSDQGSITSRLVYSNIPITGLLAWNLAPCHHASSAEQRHRRLVLIYISHQVTPMLNGFPSSLGKGLNSLPPLQRPCTNVTPANLCMSCLSSLWSCHFSHALVFSFLGHARLSSLWVFIEVLLSAWNIPSLSSSSKSSSFLQIWTKMSPTQGNFFWQSRCSGLPVLCSPNPLYFFGALLRLWVPQGVGHICFCSLLKLLAQWLEQNSSSINTFWLVD